MSGLTFKLRFSNLLPILLFLIAYYIDHGLAGMEVYPVYLIPVLWMSSKWGWPIASLFAVAAAILSTPISPFLAWSSNLAYLNSFATRSITLVLLCILYSNYLNLIRTYKKRYEQLKILVPQCPDCGAVFCCDGEWRTLEKLLSDSSSIGVMPRHDCNSAKLKTEQ